MTSGPVALVEFEQPNRVKRMIYVSTKPIYKLTAADRALFAISRFFQEYGCQATIPMSPDVYAVTKHYTVVMKI